MSDYKEFIEMVSYRRPHNSDRTEQFAKDFLLPLGVSQCDKSDNYIIDIGESRTLFSSHIDTVHRNDEMQKVYVDSLSKEVFKGDNEPLGADDASGVWLMMNMVRAGIPGRYVFHVGEECGGIGSRALLEHAPHLLENIDRAVAFDRRGKQDVITHQGWSRCASDEFAKALSAELGMGYRPDDGGVFTDTANYTDVVPECTNISVGYNMEHTAKETQDLTHLQALSDQLMLVKWEELPVERDPSVVEDKWSDWDERYYTPRRHGSTWGNAYIPSTTYDSRNYKRLTADEIRHIVMYEPEVAEAMLMNENVLMIDYLDARVEAGYDEFESVLDTLK